MSQPSEEPNAGSFVLDRLKIQAMLPSLAVNAIIPYLIYQIVTALGFSTFTALIVAAVAPAAGTVAGLVKNRRADVVGIVSLVFFSASGEAPRRGGEGASFLSRRRVRRVSTPPSAETCSSSYWSSVCSIRARVVPDPGPND